MKKEERTPIRARGLQMLPFADHDEWLKIRKGYIGGSDAGAIVGLNPYSSAFSVWAEKTETVPAFEGNISTRTGTMLEELVAKLFMEETGKKVQKLKFTLVNPDYPFACANIDREIIGEDAILECKTTNSLVNVSKFRNGEFPDQWYAQVTHYMGVTGAKKAYLAVLIECRDFRIFELDRDQAEIDALMDAERDFWNNYVLTRTVPPTDGHSATSAAVKAMFDTGDDNVTADLSDMDEIFQMRKVLAERIKDMKSDLDAIDNRVKVRMQNAIKGTCGHFTVSWKAQNTSGLDREKIKADYPDIDFSKYTSQSRVFRVTEKKEKTA